MRCAVHFGNGGLRIVDLRKRLVRSDCIRRSGVEIDDRKRDAGIGGVVVGQRFERNPHGGGEFVPRKRDFRRQGQAGRPGPADDDRALRTRETVSAAGSASPSPGIAGFRRCIRLRSPVVGRHSGEVLFEERFYVCRIGHRECHGGRVRAAVVLDREGGDVVAGGAVVRRPGEDSAVEGRLRAGGGWLKSAEQDGLRRAVRESGGDREGESRADGWRVRRRGDSPFGLPLVAFFVVCLGHPDFAQKDARVAAAGRD